VTSLHGCHNRTLLPTFVVKDGYDSVGDLVWKTIPDITSRDCKYTIDTPDDERCVGCRHIKKQETINA
jgi:hypothetical protein